MVENEPRFAGIVHGINAPVVAPEPLAEPRGQSGIAVSRMLVDNEHQFVITVRHTDGTLLSCILDEAALDRFAGQFGDAIAAANALDMQLIGPSGTLQ